MKLPLRLLPLAVGLSFVGQIPLTAAPDKPEAATAPLISGLADLKELDHKLVAAADKTAAATVSLMSTKGQGAGSGVIVSKDGLVLTAAHVLASLSGDIIVLFPDGKRAKAKSLGADFDRDAAMVQITDQGEYPCVEVADPEPLPINSWCLALGHPGGFDPLRTPPLRLGRILVNSEFIHTDCTVVSGDSGGPLFDTAGRVIGIHSNIGSSLGENRHVPIKVYRDQWEDLRAGKRSGERFNHKPGENGPKAEAPGTRPTSDRPFGIKFGKESPEGVAIEEVAKDSPAATAGLKAGDVIVRLAGRQITNAKEFATALEQRKPRPNVMLAYRRDGEIQRLRLPVPPPAEAKPQASTTEEKLNKILDKCLAEAKSGRVELKLTPEEIAEFGGMEKFQELLKERLASKFNAKPDFKVQGHEPIPAPKNDQERDEIFAKLRERGKANGGRLGLTPEDIKNLGGIEEIKKRLGSGPDAMDPFFVSVMGALKTLAKDAASSTVSVQADGKEVALGTVVSTDGGILTKDSETSKGAVTVKIGDKTYPATLVKRFPEWDLALFHIQAHHLRPMPMDSANRGAVRGSLLTVSGPQTDPLGIGMVSVKTRPLSQIGFLGIETDRSNPTPGRVLAKVIQKGGPADKCGFKDGDVITAINGKPVSDTIQFSQTIMKFKPNENVKFDVIRDEEEITLEVKLGERPMPKMGKEFQKINEMSGPLSPKRDGFPMVLQHDIPLEPSQCGGPLLDLDGRCVGINVARAGRVNTLAIPADKIAGLLGSARGDLAAVAKKANAAPVAADDDAVTAQEIAEVTKALEDLQRRLKRLEKRLAPAAPVH